MTDALLLFARTEADPKAQLDSKIPTNHGKTQDEYSLQELSKVEADSLLQLWAKTSVAVAAVLFNTLLNWRIDR